MQNLLRALLLLLFALLSSGAHAGFVANGVCYADTSQAADAYFSSQPVSVSPGSTSYFQKMEKHVDGNWFLAVYQMDTGSSTLVSESQISAPSFAPCPDFDPSFAGSVFAFFFMSTLVLWLTSKYSGVILTAIRSF